ncbi:MAG: cytochrome b5-like heme/steroid binding domain-containing protein [Microgenomates group bacterium]
MKELIIGLSVTVVFLIALLFSLPVRKQFTIPTETLITPTIAMVTTTPTEPLATPTETKVIATPTNSVKVNSFSASEVGKHNTRNDCWIIIKNNVYNVTNFLSVHPGGAGEIIPYCGRDATAAFQEMEKHDSRARASLSTLLIGSLN